LEFAGKLDEAGQIFDRFRQQPQAGPFLKHAWYHQQLIAHIKRADEDTTRLGKSMIYHMISANYWDLGFRYRAVEMLRRVLQIDSAFSPGLVFGTYYALQQGDYRQAKAYTARLVVVDPRHLMVKPLQSLFAVLDSLRSSKTAKERAKFRLNVARTYASIGLAELAIDQVLLALSQDSTNAEALKGLADLYEKKRRNAPAILVLNRLLEVEPMNRLARSKRDSLVSLR
jgi:tetratricopeptide (TPR) repeat protein